MTTLIKNGMIYDGSGEKPYKSDMLIKDDKIIDICLNINKNADKTIYALGKVVCPGFIDIHRHCDSRVLTSNTFGDAELTQGITTIVVGNCGISMTPCNLDIQKLTDDFNQPVLGTQNREGIYSFKNYMKKLETINLATNFAAMIGTGAAKISVKGFSNTPYTKDELEKTKNIISDALESGAIGVSVGIMYIPECYSTIEEYAEILKPVSHVGKIVTAHIRGEGDSLVESVAEIIEIGKKAGCSVHISHFKSGGMNNWNKKIHEAIKIIEDARLEGQDVTCDFYPYEGGSTSLNTLIPPAFINGDMKKTLEKLGTKEGIEEFKKSVGIKYNDWDNYAISLGWDKVFISGVNTLENQKYIGKSVTESTDEYDFSSPEALVAHLMHSENGQVAIIVMSMCQDDIDTVASLPYSFVISDAIYADTNTPHPRMFGAFPKIIKEYVKERKIFSLEEAIKKMTSMPAKRMSIEKRGLLKPNFYADINIFDKNVFRDNATFKNPANLATGLDYCILNGKVTIENDKRLDEFAGVLLKG